MSCHGMGYPMVTVTSKGNAPGKKSLHDGSTQIIATVDGVLTIPQLMSQTELPLMGRIVFLRTEQITAIIKKDAALPKKSRHLKPHAYA